MGSHCRAGKDMPLFLPPGGARDMAARPPDSGNSLLPLRPPKRFGVVLLCKKVQEAARSRVGRGPPKAYFPAVAGLGWLGLFLPGWTGQELDAPRQGHPLEKVDSCSWRLWLESSQSRFKFLPSLHHEHRGGYLYKFLDSSHSLEFIPSLPPLPWSQSRPTSSARESGALAFNPSTCDRLVLGPGTQR